MGCFGNIYCVLYCFVNVYLFLFVLSVLVQGLLSPSDNSIAVSNNNNNNKYWSFGSGFEPATSRLGRPYLYCFIAYGGRREGVGRLWLSERAEGLGESM